RLRPRAAPPRAPAARAAQPAVLVLGVYLSEHPNLISSIVTNLASTSGYRVVQRWVAIGPASPDPAVQLVTRACVPAPVPKFVLINNLLAGEELDGYEYVVLVDDDIYLPALFLDQFLTAQAALDFRLAQPARTQNSFIDHRIVTQVADSFARQTRFVE